MPRVAASSQLQSLAGSPGFNVSTSIILHAFPLLSDDPNFQVTIFNWLGRPNKTTMLEKLELMVRATDSIIEHDGHEGGKGKVFGHLIILARDLSGPDRAEEIRELLLDNEDPGSSGDRKGAANRNTIRDGLRSSFQSIIVRTLPTPHSHIEGEFHVHCLDHDTIHHALATSEHDSMLVVMITTLQFADEI